jgi:hypothetical protein
MVPYSSTCTVEIILTLSIALTLLIAVLLRGFLSNGIVLLAAFLPAGTPLALVYLVTNLIPHNKIELEITYFHCNESIGYPSMGNTFLTTLFIYLGR